MLKKSKVEIVYEGLSDQISDMKSGDRMPTVRQLMQDFGVSQLTVMQALGQLESDGILTREPGQGYFVRDAGKADTDLLRICFMASDWPSKPVSELEEMLKTLGSTAKCQISRYNYPVGGSFPSNFPVRDYDVVALIPEVNMLTPEFIYTVGTLPVPVIICWVPISEVRVNSVYGDPFMTGAEAASYLIRKGHRDLAVMVSSCMDSSVIQARIEGFNAIAKTMNCNVSTIDADIKPGDFAQEKTYNVLSKRLKNQPLDFTAMYLVIDEAALAVTKAFSEHNIKVPDQVSLIGSDASRHSAFYQPPLTTVGIQSQSVAEGIINTAKRLKLESDVLVKYCLPPVLIERDSVRDLIK